MQVISHFLLILLVSIDSPSQNRGEFSSIDVPPGGYAWSIYDEFSGPLAFTAVSTFAPGPWSFIDDQRLREVLTEPALEALDLTDEWLISDLQVRFTDLLFEPVDVSSPVWPSFAHVNDDYALDLIMTDADGNIHAFVAPYWEESTSSIEDIESQAFCDINNDGHADTALISDEGILTIKSGNLLILTVEGFDFSAVTGVALSDMEGDGLADLVAGSESGKVLVFRNRGTVETPLFLPFSSKSELFFPMNPGAFTVPVIYSVDDTTICLAAGTQQSGLKLYHLDSNPQDYSVEWVEMESALSSGKLQNISPVSIHLNGETRLICSTRSGVLYEMVSGQDSLQLLNLPTVPGTYPSLAFGCLNEDSEPDLIAGTMEGDVFLLRGFDGWFEGSWELIQGLPLIPSGDPAVFDDGIIFGSKEGVIRYFTRTEEETWIDVTDNSPFREIYVGEYSSPCMADLNGDDVDELIIGNSNGNLTCYELDENACDGEPFFIEKHSFRFSANRAVTELESYYSRYFFPYSLLCAPSDTMTVNAFAREIVKADPLIRDEIAYCIANTPTEVLRDMYENGDSDIFSINASQLYSVAEELEYVRLTESTDGTVCELLIDDGWVSISRENYYRFIVNPRILFEVPARICADYWLTDADSLELSMEDWLRHEPDSLLGESESHVFWREALPSDSTHGPVLFQSMREARTYEEAILRICNFQSHSQPKGIMTFGYLTNDLQPMVIYRKGYGSCGEQSILQTALCRIFFIPAYVVGCRGEDHQWNHYLNPSDGRWNHWDINYGLRGIGQVWVSGEGNAHRGKTISTITAFGPEDTVWPVTRSVIVPFGSGYMSGDSGYTATANVEVYVTDARGTPVEGAMVLLRSHWDRADMVSIYNYTDELGKCSFEPGWEPYGGYTIDIVTPYGVTGCSNISFSEGKDYSLEFSVSGTIPDLQKIHLPEGSPSDGLHTASVLYPVSYYTGTLYSLTDDVDDNGGYRGTRWTEWPANLSSVRPVYMDSENFRKYSEGFNCRALVTPFRSETGDTCFVVLDNRNNLFTWRRFSGTDIPYLLPDDLMSADTAWFNTPVPVRIPRVFPVQENISFDSSGSQNWIKMFSEVQMEQDDSDDPLSAGWTLGPFRLPASERSLSIGTTGLTSGLDMDLFLFRDQNSNRLVDGMSEVAESSSSPTADESIFIPDPDTSAVYWIYMQGWQVPEGGGKVNLGLTFEPEMLRIHSLEPSGYLDSIPELFSFEIEPELLESEQILVLFGSDSSIPWQDDDKWIFERPSQCGKSEAPVLSILDENGELIERALWTVQTDSTPPVISEYSVDVDSTLMFAYVTAACSDEGSGIQSSCLSAEGLEDVTLVMGDDSTWTGKLNLTEVSAQPISITLSFDDMAGNETVSEPCIITVPERPLALFHSEYPEGTIYDHRPVLQICVDFADSSMIWEARALLSDSSGDVVCELSPIVTYEDMVQFRSISYLDEGEHSIDIIFLSNDGEEIAEYSWSFIVDRMNTSAADTLPE